MSQDFKFNFKGGDEKGQSTENDNNIYSQPGNVRNLCFEWPDGRKKFLNYAYLVSADFEPERNVLKLIFTSEVITIKGIRLELLFNQLFLHLANTVICSNNRYEIIEMKDFIVNEIIIDNFSRNP
ncbi:hypothetical protein [Mucilaginibacter polytrichastri]|uniref:hypothetical protein n=1 Tax=Mucilaginibacter polytrichastri TaxID=1302689 RepID=UPI0008DF6A8A|nr:hypothetical protein [Mucilaginibacter polytrichastri]SFT08729.1 hypothetical protein SAMN04487890_11054 [Mucilaginibacter polytrichastri]